MPNKGNILKIILTLIAFLLVHASQAQVLKFMGRYDVSRVDSINDTTFRLSGEFVDLTGSYTAMDADINDKIIMRGYNSTGKIVYDRFKIVGIDAANTSTLEVFVISDYPSGVQNMTGWPGTGSFPIASPTSDTSKLTYRTSYYMNGIDPDYDAALDNLNLREVWTKTETGINSWELIVPTDGVTSFELPFEPHSTSTITYNGAMLRRSQWSIESAISIKLNVDVKRYDHIVVIN